MEKFPVLRIGHKGNEFIDRTLGMTSPEPPTRKGLVTNGIKLLIRKIKMTHDLDVLFAVTDPPAIITGEHEGQRDLFLASYQATKMVVTWRNSCSVIIDPFVTDITVGFSVEVMPDGGFTYLSLDYTEESIDRLLMWRKTARDA